MERLKKTTNNYEIMNSSVSAVEFNKQIRYEELKCNSSKIEIKNDLGYFGFMRLSEPKFTQRKSNSLKVWATSICC